MKTINLTYRIISLTLALLILVSSVGFSLDTHYCKGELKTVSLFSKAKNCHDVKAKSVNKHCNHSSPSYNPETTLKKKDCCQNITYHFLSDFNKKENPENIVVNLKLVKSLFAANSAFFTNHVCSAENQTFTHYKPPLISKNISPLYQIFLL